MICSHCNVIFFFLACCSCEALMLSNFFHKFLVFFIGDSRSTLNHFKETQNALKGDKEQGQ